MAPPTFWKAIRSGAGVVAWGRGLMQISLEPAMLAACLPLGHYGREASRRASSHVDHRKLDDLFHVA